MELIKEYSAVNVFPLELPCYCFFHMQQDYCCLTSFEKRLYKSNHQNLEIIILEREYRKLLYCGGCFEYLAYTHSKQKNEIVLHYLDQNCREFDIQNLRVEGNAGVEDMWLDAEAELLYFVYPVSIQKYNLNGDYLGLVMKSPADTRYQAVCTWEDKMFIAYERLGCVYVGEYSSQGIYRDRISIGGCFSVSNMEIVYSEAGSTLNLYGKRQNRMAACLEIALGSTGDNKEAGENERKKEISVELLRGNGVEGTTCYLSCSKEQTGV